MQYAAEHMIKTGYAALDHMLLIIYSIFLTPGEVIMRAFVATPWGHDWVSKQDYFPLTIVMAMLFWTVAFSILAAMDDVVRRFITRRQHPRNPRNVAYLVTHKNSY